MKCEFRTNENEMKMMDETDQKIVAILQRNARTPFLEIAKSLGIAESTVRKRVKVLEGKGAIRKYSALVDPTKMGFGSVAYVGVDVMPEHFLSVSKKLTDYDEIRVVTTCSGDHSIMTEIWMEDSHQLRRFISDKIETLTGVTRTCPAIVADTLKAH